MEKNSLVTIRRLQQRTYRDAIDKVQVYDKQSDQAQLTGFEDGNTEKRLT
ncbi:MAG: hypothetical protein IPI78_12305 [Chitinophagaceae bacterium]|nr:hypothetical protein [Chitinophagaceae bacterium]